MKKYVFVISIFLLLGLVGISASASSLTDTTGDVAHWKVTDSTWGWSYDVGDKPNIDITGISYSTEGERLTLTMTVAGSIESSELVMYWAIMNTSDSTYLMTYTNGEGGGYAMSIGTGAGQMDFEPETTVSGNTLSCTYTVVGESFDGAEFWGYATEYTQVGDITAEWWGDWVPEDTSPFYGTESDDSSDDSSESDGTSDDATNDDQSSSETSSNDNTNSNTQTKGTPGFELLVFLASLVICVVMIKRER